MEDNTQPLTAEETAKNSAIAKAETLSKNLGRKVFPIVLRSVTEADSFVFGYAYKPDIVTQCRLIDKSEGNANGINLEAACSVLEALLITAECDAQLTDKTQDNYEVYFKGAAFKLKDYMGLAIPLFF